MPAFPFVYAGPMATRNLTRRLGLWDTKAIIIGTIIGSGVFIVPGEIARALPSAEWILAIWAVGGLLSLCGALAFAELGAMLPHSGGQYVYLREAYSPLWGFLFSWVLLLVIRSGGTATLAVGFSIYLSHLVPMPPVMERLSPPAIILALTILNYRTLIGGAMMQNITTFLKVAGLLFVAGTALFHQAPSATGDTGASVIDFGASEVGSALLACLWAYNGWFQAGFVGGEIRNPGRNLPISLGIGVGIVMLLYLLANVAYMQVLTVEEIAGTERVAAVVLERVFGLAGGTMISLIILVSITGAMNAGILTGPRVYFAQARDSLFFRIFGEVHQRFHTPAFAVLLQGAWAALLSLSGTYTGLFSFVMFVAWIFYGMTVLGVIILRKKRPEWERPYRMWGYPVTPLLFGLASLWLVVNTMLDRPVPSLAGLALIASGLPLFYRWRRHARPSQMRAT
ncbi:MAG: amino acid permease [Bryobacterales bacterium]|nr:amino acid permease [Bryobacterales bacterium]